MKTGRVRQKETAPPEPVEGGPSAAPVAQPPKPRPPYSPPQKPGKRPGSPGLIFGILITIFVCCVVGIIIAMTMRGGTDEWVKATRANGAWTTTVTVYGPQVAVQEAWETECQNNPSGTVRTATCVLRDATTYTDKVVDDYEEYAYNIYYDETWARTYQSQGTSFVVTGLGADDWWEENLHYTRVEELDKDSCQYTQYTVWVDDRQNSTQEIEVFLSECEVWDHVVVEERNYDQKAWCQCDVVTLVQASQESGQGTGLDVRWPEPYVPTGGKTERTFQGQVTFLGSDYTYTTSTDELPRYQDLLTSQYYIGIRDDKAVTVSKNPKD